ncbi:hypothetical protein F5Y15DRAFT_412382 [Xylariaceae sp. FL0016]|nr:hypothetical protein F5Y15DRAFT_412382 [Xylariaceae sp. FL0016]
MSMLTQSYNAVVLCTAALFFSGYVIQQRTLRDLRIAIRPPDIRRPKPKFYSPGQSGKHTVRLEDGRMIELGGSEYDEAPGQEELIVVRPTEPEDAPQKPLLSVEDIAPEPEAEPEDRRISWDGVQLEGEKPLSRAERRRRIKEEIQRLSQGESPVYYQRRLW